MENNSDEKFEEAYRRQIEIENSPGHFIDGEDKIILGGIFGAGVLGMAGGPVLGIPLMFAGGAAGALATGAVRTKKGRQCCFNIFGCFPL